ncbi:SDR family oxidoreductase [Ferruginibacter yonginensis]|uniref:SDR family oxidoreductase n=1 Tax=Ferruginibacter yonginensis TaxID=1310416 RepID=A0ABV8QP98_9BACT
MNDFFKGKTVAVTGGSDGIGKALVTLLIQAGANVATCARTPQKLEQLKTLFADKPFWCVPADVSVYEDCKHFIEGAIEQFGCIDILINNAGISMRAELKDADVTVFKKVMDINYLGTVYCTKLALQSIINNKGTIVGVSSIAGYRGLPGRSGYSASKFAVNGWLEAVRTELIQEGVNVMWVCPGFTQSNIRNAALNEKAAAQGESPLEEGSLMSSTECAQHILKAIEKRKRTLVLTFTGKRTVFMNKFFAALTDKLTYNFFYKKGKLIK